MDKINSAAHLWPRIRQAEQSGLIIGFVPTMGALHKGHISLVEKARTACDLLVVSIFVNPTQFNDAGDFERYPRMPEQDAHMLSPLCDILFMPSLEDIYPNGKVLLDESIIGKLNFIYEGEKRPGHFQGVITVVHRLFELIKPQKAYFGLKDFQQLLVIKRMAATLHPNVQIIGLPTLRETDGLAMSSRNLLLSKEERTLAAEIPKQLFALKEQWLNYGADKFAQSLHRAINSLQAAGIKVEYLSVAGAESLEPYQNGMMEQPVLLFAGRIGNIRLIDNLQLVNV